MKKRLLVGLVAAVWGMAGGLQGASGASKELQEKVAALKQTLQQNQARLKQYEWIETVVVSKDGNEKSRKQNRCYYGSDGKIQKVPISASQQDDGGRRRGIIARIKENKKEEMVDYLEQASDLTKQYIPPNFSQIQASLDAGKASVHKADPGIELQFKDYLKPGDSLSVDLDPAKQQLTGLKVATYLDSPKDEVTLDVTFASLDDGTRYPAQTVLNTKKKDVSVTLQNSGYRKTGS